MLNSSFKLQPDGHWPLPMSPSPSRARRRGCHSVPARLSPPDTVTAECRSGWQVRHGHGGRCQWHEPAAAVTVTVTDHDDQDARAGFEPPELLNLPVPGRPPGLRVLVPLGHWQAASDALLTLERLRSSVRVTAHGPGDHNSATPPPGPTPGRRPGPSDHVYDSRAAGPSRPGSESNNFIVQVACHGLNRARRR